MNTFLETSRRCVGLLALAPAAPTSGQGERQQPSDAGKILFQSTQGGDGFVNEIYVMGGDGKHQTRLTTNEFDDTSPLWSPQGNLIAFLSDRGVGYDIHVMNPDGTGERVVRDAEVGGPLVTDNIEWSPDGRSLMYSVGGAVKVVEVLAADNSFSSAPVRNLSAGAPSYAFDNNPAWSPDGLRIAFVSNACAGCLPDIFVMNADGPGRTQLSTDAAAEFAPAWTPDGRVAYGSFRSSPANTYVVNPDGTGEQPLAGVVADVSGPVWSPDGTRVVAHASNDGNWIDVISLGSTSASRNVTNLTRTRKADEFAYSWR